MKNQINWGIIGCGNVTEVKSGPAFNRVKDSNLKAVMRRNSDKAKDYARRHHVPKWYDNAKKLIDDPDIDAVYVATPPGSHAKHTIMAAEAGKHVYVEKPMALNFSECQEMIHTAKKVGVSLFVAYYRRCLPYFIKIKELVESGVIGTPRFVNIKLFKPPFINTRENFAKKPNFFADPNLVSRRGGLLGCGCHPLFRKKLKKDDLPWRFKPEISGGGLFVDLGSHQLDFLDYVFGPIVSVKSFVMNQAGLYPAEDIVSANFLFETGTLGSGTWCFTVPEKNDTDEIVLVGSKGRIFFSTFDFKPIKVESEPGIETFSFQKPKYIQEALIQTVVDELLNRGQCPSTGITASRTTRIMDEILKDYYS